MMSEEVFIIPMSFAQQRLWFLDQLEPGNPIYNMPAALNLEGRVDVALLERCLNEVVERHEVLRTKFVAVDGEPRQLILPALKLTLPVIDLQGLAPAEREERARELSVAEARRGFDLGAGPLLRALMLRLEDERHLLLITLHHIVADGWSTGIFAREVAALYEAFAAGGPSPLPPLPVQYADFAVWQREWLTGSVLEEQLEYWKRLLAGAPATLELPTDRPRPAAQNYR